MADCGGTEPHHRNLQEEHLRLCSGDTDEYCWIQFLNFSLDNSDALNTAITHVTVYGGLCFVDVDVGSEHITRTQSDVCQKKKWKNPHQWRV